MKWYWWAAIGTGVVVVASLPVIAFARRNDYDAIIKRVTAQYKIPFLKFALKGLIATESSFNPTARAGGNSSAAGLTQLTKGAAKDAGVDYSQVDNPEVAISGGAAYLAMLYNRFGSLSRAIRAYYQGAGNELKGLQSPIFADANAYKNKVLRYAWAFALKEPWGLI